MLSQCRKNLKWYFARVGGIKTKTLGKDTLVEQGKNVRIGTIFHNVKLSCGYT